MAKTTWKDYSLKDDGEGAAILTADSFEDEVEQEWFLAKSDGKAFRSVR